MRHVICVICLTITEQENMAAATEQENLAAAPSAAVRHGFLVLSLYLNGRHWFALLAL